MLFFYNGKPSAALCFDFFAASKIVTIIVVSCFFTRKKTLKQQQAIRDYSTVRKDVRACVFYLALLPFLKIPFISCVSLTPRPPSFVGVVAGLPLGVPLPFC